MKGFKSYSLNSQKHRQTNTQTQLKHYLPTYVGGNEFKLIGEIPRSEEFHLAFGVPNTTLVSLHKNPLYTSNCCNFGTLPEHQLKSILVISTCSCIKVYVTQAINFHHFLQKKVIHVELHSQILKVVLWV